MIILICDYNSYTSRFEVINENIFIFRSDLSDQLPNGDPDRITQGINNVIAAIIPRLKDFHNLLVTPPKVS